MPTTIMPTSTTKAPGALTRSAQRWTTARRRARPPPCASASASRRLPADEVDEPLAAEEDDEAAEARRRPSRGRRGRPLDEHAGHDEQDGQQPRALAEEPAAGSRRRSRLRMPAPGRNSAMSVTAPSTSRTRPTAIERDVRRHERRCRRRGASLGERRPAASRAARRAPSSRGHRLRPRPRPGRPSAGAWSARRGTATGRP